MNDESTTFFPNVQPEDPPEPDSDAEAKVLADFTVLTTEERHTEADRLIARYADYPRLVRMMITVRLLRSAVLQRPSMEETAQLGQVSPTAVAKIAHTFAGLTEQGSTTPVGVVKAQGSLSYGDSKDQFKLSIEVGELPMEMTDIVCYLRAISDDIEVSC